MKTEGNKFFISGGSVKILCLVLACYACFVWAALRHQQRALEQALAAMELGHPTMMQMSHLARCVSFNLPVFQSTTRECLDLADRVMKGLEGKNRAADLRLARSMLCGAIESSLWENKIMREKKNRLVLFIHPPSSHPLKSSVIMPAEPYAFTGTIAGSFLVIITVYLFGIKQLTKKITVKKRKKVLTAAVMCTVLFIVFVLCLLAA